VISNKNNIFEKMLYYYMEAKWEIIEQGFHPEIDWQEEIIFEEVTETDFIREAAWVILSSGMRETVIRGKFEKISKAFFNWASAEIIHHNSSDCRKRALQVFRNTKKIDAIIKIASHVYFEEFETVKSILLQEKTIYLRRFPFLGPATSYHLAKNIGLPVAKPDRHLCRIAEATGFETPNELCNEIAQALGENISVVDLVLWRFATINKNYIEFFTREYCKEYQLLKV